MAESYKGKFSFESIFTEKGLDEINAGVKELDKNAEKAKKSVDDLTHGLQNIESVKINISTAQARRELAKLEKYIERIHKSPRHTVKIDEFINSAKTLKGSGKFTKELEHLTKDISVKINGAVVNGIDDMIVAYEKGVAKVGKIKFTPPAPTFSQEYIDKAEKDYKGHMIKLIGISRKLNKAMSENASFNEIADLKNVAEAEKESMQELAVVLKNNNDLIKEGAKAVKQYRDAVKQLDGMKVGDQVVSEPKSVAATKEQIKMLKQLKKESDAANKAFYKADEKLHEIYAKERELKNNYGEIEDYVKKANEISTRMQNISLEDLPAAKQKKQHKEYANIIEDTLKKIIDTGGSSYRTKPTEYSAYNQYLVAIDEYNKHTNQELNDMLSKVMSEIRKVYTDSINALINADRNQVGQEREGVLKKRELDVQHTAATLDYNTSADKSSEATRKLYDYEKELEELGVDVKALNEQIEKSLVEAKKPKKKEEDKYNEDAVIKRFNKLMQDIGAEGSRIDKKNDINSSWNLRDMVAELDAQRKLRYNVPPSELGITNKDEVKKFNSEKGKIDRFIKTFEPLVAELTTSANHNSKYDNTPKADQKKQLDAIVQKNSTTKENVEAIKQETEAHKQNKKAIEAETKSVSERQKIHVKGSISYLGRSKNDFNEVLDPTAIIHANTTDEVNNKAIEDIIESWFKKTNQKENYSGYGASDSNTWYIPMEDRNEYDDFKEHWLAAKKKLATIGKISPDITQETQAIQQQTQVIQQQVKARKDNVKAIEAEKTVQEKTSEDSLLKEISTSEKYDARQNKEQQSVERALLEASKKKLELENKDVEKVAEQLALDTSIVEEKKVEKKKRSTKKSKSKKVTTPDEGQLSLFDTEPEQQVLQTEQAISKEEEKQVELAQQNTNESTKELEVAKEQLETEKAITAEKGKRAKTKKTAKPIFDDSSSGEVSVDEIIERNLNESLRQIREAKNNVTSLFNLTDVFSGDDLIDQARNMVSKVASIEGLSLKQFDVADNHIKVTLYNDALKTTVTQTYALAAATEEADARLELIGSKYSQNVKALTENKFDIEGTIAKAESQIKKFESTLNGLKYDTGNLETLAHGIKSQDDYKKFSNMLKAAENEVQAIKNSTATKNTMDPLKNMRRDIQNATTEIETMRINLEKLGDVEGVSKARNLIEQMTSSVDKFNKSSDMKEQQGAYNDYSDYRSQFNAQLKLIRAQEDLRKKQRNEQKQIAATNTATNESGVKQTYESLLNTVQKINSINQDILKYQDKDNGSGVLSSFISGLKSDKQVLENELKSITDRINAFYADGFIQGDKKVTPFSSTLIDEKDYSSITAFLNDVKTQFILSEKEVDNLLNSLKKAQEIDITVADKMVEMFKPLNETNSRLSGIKGLNKDAASPLVGMASEIKTYKDKLESQEISWDSSEMSYLKKLIEAYTEYGSKLADIAEKEQRYFSNKQKYTSDLNTSDVTNVNVENEKAYNNMRKKLEDSAREFAKNSGVDQIFTTGFSQGADGIAKLDFSVFDSATNSLRNFKMEMGSVTDNMSITETTVSKSLANINAAQKQVEATSKLLGVFSSSGVNVGEGATKSVTQLVEKVRLLQEELSKGDNADQNLVTKLTKDLKIATSESERAYKQMLKMQDGVDSKSFIDRGTVDTNGNIYAQAKQQIESYAQTVPNATAKIGALNEQTGKIPFTINVANKEMRKCEAQINSLTGQMTIQEKSISQIKSSVHQASGAYGQFKTSISSVGKQIMSAAIGYNVFYKALSMFRTGVGYVKEIDLAMTELKKVTDETAATYDKFLDNAYKSAGGVGATVSEFTEASANFARLGYDLDQSSSMAQTAIVYKNVADGLNNIDDATESIVSTMKAFNIEAEDTMSIADKFNEIGNSYSISSAGIGEALKRSASSLAAAGNTLDESIALVTGANAVVQDPEVVGTALKTLSLRIRGRHIMPYYMVTCKSYIYIR